MSIQLLLPTFAPIPGNEGSTPSLLDRVLQYVQGPLDDFTAWISTGYNGPMLIAMIVVGAIVLRPDLPAALWRAVRRRGQAEGR